MKHILNIFLISILILSCRKEKLKDEKEVFIGKWELQYAIERTTSLNPGNSYCKLDTVFPPYIENATLTFKKKGKIILEKGGKKKRFSMNFKERKDVYTIIDFYALSDSIEICSETHKSIGKVNWFRAVTHSAFQFSSYTPLEGYINDKWLVLLSSSKIIDESINSTSNGLEGYYNIFKKVD